MPLDYNILNKGVSLLDNQRLQQDFELKKQAAQLANQSAANIYKTQVLSAAAGSGDQNVVNNALQHLNSNGIDTSDVPTDLPTLSRYADAARLAQSPLGTLFQAQQKIVANNQAAIQALGGVAQAKAAGQYQDVPNLTSFGVPSVSGVNSMPDQVPVQPTIQPRPQAAPKILSNGQPQLPIPPLPNMGNTQPEPPAIDGDVPTVPVSNNGGLPPYNPPAPEPGDSLATTKQKQDAYDAAYKMNNAAAIKAADSAGGKQGEAIGDIAKTVNIMQSNLPAVLQRFENMRAASDKAGYGFGNNNEGDGFMQSYHKNFSNSQTGDANALLSQAASQGILPELGPQLAQAGIRGNKFLETLASSASGLDLAASPTAKQKVINGLENTYISNLKSSAAQLRANGQPAPTNAEIDAQVAKLKASYGQQPQINFPNLQQPSQPVYNNFSGFKYIGVRK